MFSASDKSPGKLTDEALQQELAALETRHKRTGRIGFAIFLLGLAACVGAGGTFGFLLMGSLPGAAAAGAALFGIPFGALLGLELVCAVGDKISGQHRSRYEFRQRPLSAELKQRALLRAAEEEQMKKPLDAGAREAFILSLSSGTEDAVEVLKPLRLKKTRVFTAFR